MRIVAAVIRQAFDLSVLEDSTATMLRTAARSLLQASGSLPNAAVAQHHLLAHVVQAAVQQAAPATLTNAWTRLFAKGAGPGKQQGGAAAADSASGEPASSSSGDEAESAAAAADLDVAELQELLVKAQEEAAAFKDRLQRSHAELQNLIARTNREKETLQTYAVQKFAESLLEVADNLESAARAVPQDVLREGAQVPADTSLKYLRALLEGVQATERVLLKTMGGKGVTRIETAAGDGFDPNTMEAMTTVPCPGGDAKPGTIANVWQSGYKIHDRILRAAKVIVYQE